MLYGMNDTLHEIMRRSEVIRRRRQRRTIYALMSMTMIMFVSLVSAVSVLSSTGDALIDRTTMGAFILSPDVGGYIIVALAGFAAGVVMTMLTGKYRNKTDNNGRN